MAGGANAELRHCHPGQKTEPLRSAESAPGIDTECEELYPSQEGVLTETAALISDLAVQRHALRDKLEQRRGLKIPSEYPDWAGLRAAFPAWDQPGRDAILQPPRPQISPPPPESSSSPPNTTQNPKPLSDLGYLLRAKGPGERACMWASWENGRGPSRRRKV